ncbi:unnamed protein product [Rangifer tarandus platyrhynchus]|uniref:Uncharacterized protein n=1 Tax=Rangifer tarandus platyrhynchus TaxID=3082113 RepID=A0AC59ZWV5_RANTA
MNNFRFTELSGFHSRCPRTPMPTQPRNRSLGTRKRPFEEWNAESTQELRIEITFWIEVQEASVVNMAQKPSPKR